MEGASQQRQHGNSLFTRPVLEKTVSTYEGIHHFAISSLTHNDWKYTSVAGRSRETFMVIYVHDAKL